MNNKKLNFADRFIQSLAPKYFLERQESRLKAEVVLQKRSYDGANFTPSLHKSRKTADQEMSYSNAQDKLRFGARELVRNAPFAKKAVDVIRNGIVSYGISAQLNHSNPDTLVKIEQLWKDWTNSQMTFDGSDFSTLQQHLVESLVIDGEILLKKVFIEGTIKFQVLDADYFCLNAPKDLKENYTFVNGVVVDEYRRPVFYHLWQFNPAEITKKKNTSSLVPASDIIHLFKKERDSVRGVSWFHSVMTALSTLSELQYTNLMRQKLAASITAVVTESASALNQDVLLEQREKQWELTPNSIMYIEPNSSITFPSIPNPEGFSESTKLALREIAAGLGITYEALSNDLSQVNYSSARLGHLQFLANVSTWQWQLIVPKLLNPIFENFKTLCTLKGLKVDSLTCTWVMPSKPMLDPSTEIETTSKALRNGLMSYTEALSELGYNPKEKIQEISESNKLLDENNLVFDSDPRRTANQILQNPENLPKK